MKKTILIYFFITINLFANATYTTIKHSFVIVDFSQFSGHSIIVGNNYADWTGVAPIQDNTGSYSSNEYIYKDAFNDDVGDGDYTYPQNSQFQKGMGDIKEFRVTYDNNNLYLYVALLTNSSDATAWWLQDVLIGFSDINLTSGTYEFIEGNGIDPDKGPAVELDTAFPLQYTLAVYSTYKGRIWDANGIKIGDGNDADNSDGSINNIQVKAVEWNKYEIALPLSLIGSVSNKEIRFCVASFFDEDQMAREVQGYPLGTEWYISGGDHTWWNKLGADPDVLDLIGANVNEQISDLSDYEELFVNTTNSFEVFNFNIKPNIFDKNKDNFVTIYFTLATTAVLTLTIKDLNNSTIKTIVQNKNIIPVSVNETIEYKWDGTDGVGISLKRGAYVVEAIFKKNNQIKTIRKVVRLW